MEYAVKLGFIYNPYFIATNENLVTNSDSLSSNIDDLQYNKSTNNLYCYVNQYGIKHISDHLNFCRIDDSLTE